MGGLLAITAPAVVSGVLAVVPTFLLLGWDAQDRRETCARWARRFRTAFEGLFSRACALARGRLCPASAAELPVTLGEVSEMVDIVRLGLSAGLSFDAALELYCDGRSGSLAVRLARAHVSWQSGLSTREDELRMIARETGVRALETFAIAVSQALELGAPLAETLEGQGREMRAAHRAEVERRIERAPVKLIIPTGTLILPALLLSILGPLLAAGGMM